MKKPNPIVSAEYLDVNPDGSRGAAVKVVGNKEDLLLLWLALSLNLCKTLCASPFKLATFLVTLGSKENVAKFTDQCTTIDLSNVVNPDR